MEIVKKVTIFEYGRVGRVREGLQSSKLHTLFRALLRALFRLLQLWVFQGGDEMTLKVFRVHSKSLFLEFLGWKRIKMLNFAVILDQKRRKSGHFEGKYVFFGWACVFWSKIIQKVTIFEHGRVGGGELQGDKNPEFTYKS